MSMTLMVKVMRAKVGNPLRKLVLVKLADQANDNGECWPSYQSIADACEMSRSTVKSHIAWLAEHGFLRVEHRQYNNSKKNMTNVYYLTVDDGVAESSDGVKSRPGQIPTGSNPDRGGSNADPSNGSNPDPESVNKPIKEPLPPTGVSAHTREDAPNSESAPPCPADKPAKRTERAARIPDDFPLTDEMRTWAAEEGCSFDLDREHKKFRDYWTAAGGSKARKMDWIATWRNWMRRADEDWRRSNRQNFGGRHGENQHGHRKLTPVERVQEAQRRRYAQHWDGQPASYGDVEDGQFVEC